MKKSRLIWSCILKVMNFLIFMDFSEFILDFNSIKTIKIKAKRGLFLRGTHVDATWHARPYGRATRTYASACVARM